MDQVHVDGRPGQHPDRVGEQPQPFLAGVREQEFGWAPVIGQPPGAGLAGQLGGGSVAGGGVLQDEEQPGRPSVDIAGRGGHTFASSPDGPVRFLTVHTPGGFEQLHRDVCRAEQEAGRPFGPAEIMPIAARHDWTFAGPPLLPSGELAQARQPQ